MGELAKLPNIGPETEKQLNQVGITTYEELKNVGAKEAWLRIFEIDPSACANRLYGLQGAIEGIRKKELGPETVSDLRAFYRESK